ncbi:N-methyl-L-tryptophan oxidase [Leifsonia sp. F6_8S_P_1B]|uniref:N-methyl-L-tryptophan oxidase n=1 Tax=Leifsonia williamsii TaxID=3035919 RepID=A0ABT8K6Y7_9MICO|nr:N-methyl-L-tryptophan oxidase [Leifsonia williamsii]MDN4613191.1 N-methyl-L-tryptophan oxidase [Leifsonia williamsii]
MPTTAIVIGAGVVGAAAAWSLARQGAEVLLLEAFERGHDRGSSHGATRIFRHGYAEADYVELSVAALAGWRELERRSGRRLLDATGAVDHGDLGVLRAIAEAQEAAGLAYEWLTAAEATSRWPGLRFEDHVLFSPGGGRLRADHAVDALLDQAQAAGAELRFETRVTSIAPTDDAVTVTTADGEHTADRLVVAAGSWTPALIGPWLAAHGAALPTVAVTEEQPAHFPLVPGEPDGEAAWPSFVHHPTDDSLPSAYGLLTPGEGVKVGFHGVGPVVDPNDRDRAIDVARLHRLQEYVARWVPGVDSTSPEGISCLYDNTEQEDFVLDRVGPVVVATGFSGHGFKFGPAVGDVLARLALHDEKAPPRFRLTVASPDAGTEAPA